MAAGTMPSTGCNSGELQAEASCSRLAAMPGLLASSPARRAPSSGLATSAAPSSADRSRQRDTEPSSLNRWGSSAQLSPGKRRLLSRDYCYENPPAGADKVPPSQVTQQVRPGPVVGPTATQLGLRRMQQLQPGGCAPPALLRAPVTTGYRSVAGSLPCPDIDCTLAKQVKRATQEESRLKPEPSSAFGAMINGIAASHGVSQPQAMQLVLQSHQDAGEPSKLAHATLKAPCAAQLETRRGAVCPGSLLAEAGASHQHELLREIPPSEISFSSANVDLVEDCGASELAERISATESCHKVVKQPFNMRLATINNLTPPCASAGRARSAAVHRARAGLTGNVAKSLTALRQVLQPKISESIDKVIKAHLSLYFTPAMEVLRANKGENAVGREHILAVCREMLEEAKKQYIPSGGAGSSRSCTSTPRDSPAPSSSWSDRLPDHSRERLPFSSTRPPTLNDSLSVVGSLPAQRKRGRPKKIATPLVRTLKGTDNAAQKECEKAGKPRQWDPARITRQSLFITGSKANKALGLGATRGKLYQRHPELFKYGVDQTDKQWLQENYIMRPSGGATYLMLLDEVSELCEVPQYKDSASLEPSELQGFQIPEWMLDKVRTHMTVMCSGHSKFKATPAGSPPNDADSDQVLPCRDTGAPVLNFENAAVATKRHRDAPATAVPVPQFDCMDGGTEEEEEGGFMPAISRMVSTKELIVTNSDDDDELPELSSLSD